MYLWVYLKTKVAEVRKVPFCSPAEIEGKKMFPKTREVKCIKRRKRMELDVFYHKLIHIKVHLGVLKPFLVNIGEFCS